MNAINPSGCMCNTEALLSLSLGDRVDLQLRANCDSSPLLTDRVSVNEL